jgi:hypothetical protein
MTDNELITKWERLGDADRARGKTLFDEVEFYRFTRNNHERLMELARGKVCIACRDALDQAYRDGMRRAVEIVGRMPLGGMTSPLTATVKAVGLINAEANQLEKENQNGKKEMAELESWL